MIDFDISHYITTEAPVEQRDENWKDQFYGSLEDKPETEQQLLLLQEKYLKTRDDELWQEMWSICQSYMRSLLLKHLKNGKFMEPEEVEDKTTQATLAFMSQYKRRPEFEVGASFAGMMRYKILEALGKKPTDYSISLNNPVSDDGTELLEILDTTNSETITPTSLPQDEMDLKTDLYELVSEVLDTFDKAIGYDPRLEVLARLYLTLFLRKPRSRHAKRVFLDKWAVDFKTEQLLERVVLEVYNSIRKT